MSRQGRGKASPASPPPAKASAPPLPPSVEAMGDSGEEVQQEAPPFFNTRSASRRLMTGLHGAMGTRGGAQGTRRRTWFRVDKSGRAFGMSQRCRGKKSRLWGEPPGDVARRARPPPPPPPRHTGNAGYDLSGRVTARCRCRARVRLKRASASSSPPRLFVVPLRRWPSAEGSPAAAAASRTSHPRDETSLESFEPVGTGRGPVEGGEPAVPFGGAVLF